MNYQPRGISDRAIQGPASYLSEIGAAEALLKTKETWNGVTAEAVARMRLQNRFKTGLDIARYTAALMRSDMAAYDGDPTKYTQSLGCWHGFIAQQKLISVKKHFGTTDRRYLYLSGWMIAALRSEFGPLPDQSMHEKTSVPALIEELYTFLRQADSRELNDIFRDARRRPQGRRPAEGKGADREDRQLPDACRARDRRHRRRLRQCGGDLPARQEDDRSGRLRPADREPGLGRKAVRPSGRQGDGAARGLPGEDSRLPPCFPRTGCRRRHYRDPHQLAGCRSHAANRCEPQAGRHRRSIQQLPRLRRSDGRQRPERRCHHQPQRQDDASEAACQQSLSVPCRHRRGSLRA